MTEKFRQKLPGLFVFVTGTVFLFYFFGHFITSPNSYLLTSHGDGLKSYYVMKYHLEHDESYTHFEGMNYPYGEHIGFTDGFPALTWICQTLPFLKPYAIPILHWTIFFGYVLCAYFVYLILKHFKVSPWYAAWAAICILFLQPQTARITGHLSLSIAFFFPLAWYILLRFIDEPKLKWMLLGMLNILFWFFIHAYAGLMIVLFYVGYFFIRFLFERSTSISITGKGFLMGIVPMVLFFLFMKLTDDVADRPTDPNGFFFYTASYETVFVPNHPPLFHMISQVIKVRHQQWEGWSYIGAATMLILLFSLFHFVFKCFQTRNFKTQIQRFFPQQYFYFLLTAIFILFFSFGYPFHWFPELLEYFKPLKQFRGLGRFAWVFFYVSTILAVVLLHQWSSRAREKKFLQYGIFGFSIAFLGLHIIEGIPMQEGHRNFLNASNIFETQHLNAAQKDLISATKKADAQAILTLPYFHVGSEIFGKESSQEAMRAAFLMSYYSGKPIFGVMMGRTSFEQSIQFFRSFGPDQLEKPLAKDMKECKNLLVYHRPEDRLFPEETELLKRCVPFYQGEGYELLLLAVDSLFKKDPHFSRSYFTSQADTLIEIAEDVFIDQLKGDDFYYLHFFDEKEYPQHTSNGRYRGIPFEYSIILKLKPNVLRKIPYEVGFDYYPIEHSSALNNTFIIQSSAPEGGNITWLQERVMVSYPIQFKDHATGKFIFTPEDTTLVYEFFFKGPDVHKAFEIDHFYVRPLGTNILRKENENYFLNNLPVH